MRTRMTAGWGWMLAVMLAIVNTVVVGDARAQNNSLADLVRKAEEMRVATDGVTDSTGSRSGGGWSLGWNDALSTATHCAGILIAPNQNFGTSNHHGMAFVRRRLNASTLIGPVVPTTFGAPGYPAGDAVYGPTVPMIGIESGLSTTLNLAIGSAGATSFTVDHNERLADPALGYLAYIKIDDEIIGYTDSPTGLTGIQTINTGVARGQFGTTATTHSIGATVTRLMAWEGPQSAILGCATLTSDVTSNVSTTFNVDSTAGFTTAGSFRLPSGEIVSYTTITPTSFGGTVTRNTIPASGTAGTHTAGAKLVQVYIPSVMGIAGMMGPDHVFGANAGMKHALFTKSLETTSLSQALVQLELFTQANFVNTDNSFTSLNTGTAAIVTGGALGDITKIIQTLTQATTDRADVTLNFGTARGSTYYNNAVGGCAIMYSLLAGTDRPTGILQNQWTGRGGFSLNTYHRTLNYDGNELDTGQIERYKVFLACGDADVGGNGSVGLAHFSIFGHNETGGQGYTGLYQPGYPWTENPATSGAAIFNDIDAAATTIEVSGAAGLVANKGTLWITDGSTYEYITYEASTLVSGDVYELTNCRRGQFGTTAVDPIIGDEVKQGYLQQNPKGFASDLLFDYKFRLMCWNAAGGDADDFFYVWVRPLPVSDTTTVVADDSPITSGSTAAEREYKLRQFATTIRQYCGTLPGFIIIDPSEVITATKLINYDDVATATDNVHHTRSVYRRLAQICLAHFAYGQGAGLHPVAGVDGVIRQGGGLRGRPRRVAVSRGNRRRRGQVRNVRRAA